MLACFGVADSCATGIGTWQVKNSAKLAVRIVARAAIDVGLSLDMGKVSGRAGFENCVHARCGQQHTKICQ